MEGCENKELGLGWPKGEELEARLIQEKLDGSFEGLLTALERPNWASEGDEDMR